MKKTYKLFRLFLPLITSVSVLGAIIGIFMFIFNYRYDPVGHVYGIRFNQAAPILMFALIGIALILSVVMLVKMKHTYITKMRRDSNVLKFASALAFVVIFILTVYDLYVLLASNATLSVAKTFKVLRIIAAIPFLAYFVINVIPKRMFKRRIFIPETIVNICAIGAIAWALFGLLAIWFYEGVGYSYFKIVHIIFYVLFTFFILCEIKTQLIKANVKLHMFSALLLFVVSFVLTTSTVVASFLTDVAGNPISNFELVTAIALSIYALSKVFAYMYTLRISMNTGSGTSKHKHHRHHHHHHHHHSSESVAEAVNESSDANTTVITEDLADDVIEEDATTEEVASEEAAISTKPSPISAPYQKGKNYPQSKSSKKKKKK